MTSIMKYNLTDFSNITFNGFDFKLPQDTLTLIHSLSTEVGSPTYIRTPVFKKRENPLKVSPDDNDGFKQVVSSSGNKNRRKHKNVEIVNDSDWETLRTFHVTKIEKKEGIEGETNNIRSYLNKMTDKNYEEIKNKIIEIIDNMINNDIGEEEFNCVSGVIFEIASTNRFYSKLYADIYSILIEKYDSMKVVFENSFNSFTDLFKTISYVDPGVNYDEFCKNNKTNEKRRALSTFFVNLMYNKIVTESQLLDIIGVIMSQILDLININEKKNEVDELTENIAILCTKEILENTDYKIGELTVLETIEKLAHSKAKTYLSLSSKSIFKFMDMVDM